MEDGSQIFPMKVLKIIHRPLGVKRLEIEYKMQMIRFHDHVLSDFCVIDKAKHFLGIFLLFWDDDFA